MTHKLQPPWTIYKEELDFLCYGDALWEPSPTNTYTCIKIGDVGFIRRGQFHLLFSAGIPLGTRQRGRDVPAAFEELDIGNPGSRPPRPPGCLRSETVLKASNELTASVPPLTSESGAFSFELTEDRGAALITKYDTHRKDAFVESEFEEYTKEHYKSWVAFAREKKFGNDIHPVLVYGVDVTRDFTMVAYSDSGTSSRARVASTVEAFASTSASLQGTWYAKRMPHTNHGPEQRTGESNQCVFIRYYTMRTKGWFGLLPKVIRAGAGPHDLGSGDHSGDTFPELTAQFDVEHATSDDEDHTGHSVAEDSGSEREIVVQNIPNDEANSSWDILAGYVFQNSNAVSVLMHHRDLIGIRTAGGSDSLRASLARHMPRIAVDVRGVGKIVLQENRQPGGSTEHPNVATPADRPRTATADLHTLTHLPTHSTLRKLRDLDTTLFEYDDQLINVLYGEGYVQCVMELESDDLVWLLDYLDGALGALPPFSAAYQKCLRELRNICGTKAVLPTSCIPSSNFTVDPEWFKMRGDYRMHRGTLEGSLVCVRRVWESSWKDPREPTKAFWRDAVTWKHLEHPNIVPFLAVTVKPFQYVSVWISNVDLETFIENQDPDRLSLISDITEGLYYLHSHNVVHGDLKGNNILVDGTGHARIPDFGLFNVEHGKRQISGWTAPEVWGNRANTYTKEADIFSLAMVIVEVFTGIVPHVESVIQKTSFRVLDGERPERPADPACTDELWTSMKRCWNRDPHFRPTAEEVLNLLRNTDGHVWERLISSPLPAYERVSLIAMIFSDSDEVEMVNNLSGFDLRIFVDNINEVLDGLTPLLRRKCLDYLRRTCGSRGLFPKSLEIPLCYDPAGDPVSRGGRTYVWKGEHEGREVAIRVPKVLPGDDAQTIAERIYSKVVTWRALHHPNILRLLGVTMAGNLPGMVSNWMPKGNIREFAKANPNVDRLGLLRGVTRGLIYMHNQDVIHGNLKGANILIDSEDNPRLTDFSMVTTAPEEATIASPLSADGNLRWMSPELLYPEKFGLDGFPTVQSDVYALGMVVYEVLSGQVPFAAHQDPEVVFMTLRGERPERLQGDVEGLFTPEVWGLLEVCWKEQPRDRPSVKSVLIDLHGKLPSSWLPSSIDEELEMSTLWG